MNRICFFSVPVIILLVSCAGENDYNRYVDPFFGTGGHGHTFPGATLPFGMVQLSPDTRLSGWDGCSGYHYSDSVIYGFSHTHLSGTGVSDYGDILFMPVNGRPLISGSTDGKGYPSGFSHERETARPGYYSVYLTDHGIEAELTASLRTGFHRYTFSKRDSASIIIDLAHRDPVLYSAIRIKDDHTIQGTRISGGWAREQHVYFVAVFSVPVNRFVLFSNDTMVAGTDHVEGRNIKAWVSFGLPLNNEVLVRVGISAVSEEGAMKNLESETPAWNFDAAVCRAEEVWNRQLGKIKVKGGTKEQRRVFYTALYHACLAPNMYMDVDGRYRGRDLAVHHAEGFDYYSVFSLWDTFRGLHPLLTFLEPKRTSHFINTFIAQYEQGGLLPVWELSANETYCMIGYHSVSVIADAMMKGIRGFDPKRALEASMKSAKQHHFGLDKYMSEGFVPAEDEPESVSKTLEYAYDDWCIAQMAMHLGETETYGEFIRRAQNYKNLFDPSTGFMRARMRGAWFSPFDPREVNFNYTEANAWQYSFFVPHDIIGLKKWLGGNEGLSAKLDSLFNADPQTTGREQADITGQIGQYAHGNEPSHHMAYLYNYAGKPWKTQAMVRKITYELYTDQPDGLAGNEDCGQMSAWFVLNALGFYPVCPGIPRYDLGIPLFRKLQVMGSDSVQFTVRAKGNVKKCRYVKHIRFNNKPHRELVINHDQLVRKGKLVFATGMHPEDLTVPNIIPETIIRDEPIIPVPFLATGSLDFREGTSVMLENLENDTIFYQYTGNAGGITRFTGPLMINHSCSMEAWAVRNGEESRHIHFTFNKIPSGRTITLVNTHSNQYSAGGKTALIDGVRGGKDFRTGTWQGYEGVNLNATVSLEKSMMISGVRISFLQDVNAWVFLPENVTFYTSMDGRHYTPAGVVSHNIPLTMEGTIRHEFSVTNTIGYARYIRIIAKNICTCPPWHKGAGGKAWIFTDEIIIE